MKLSEIKEQTIEELKEKILSIRKELFTLKIQKATFKLEDVSKIKKNKKLIARIKTVIRAKQLSSTIS